MARYTTPDGTEIIGTLERVTARCEIHDIDDEGNPEYAGGTEIFWDAMEVVERDGKMIFLDETGEEWTFDQLKRVDD